MLMSLCSRQIRIKLHDVSRLLLYLPPDLRSKCDISSFYRKFNAKTFNQGKYNLYETRKQKSFGGSFVTAL